MSSSSASSSTAPDLKNAPSRKSGASTLSVHGPNPHHGQGPHVAPINVTSTFTFDSAEQGKAAFAGEANLPIYTRLGNPTVVGFEERVAHLADHDVLMEKLTTTVFTLTGSCLTSFKSNASVTVTVAGGLRKIVLLVLI